MDKKVVTGVVLMVVVNLTTLLYVNYQMHGMQKTISELNGRPVKLSPEFETNLKEGLDTVVASVKDSTDNAVVPITTDVSHAVAEMKQNVAAAKESMEETCTKLPLMMQASMGSSLASITADVSHVVADMKQNVAAAKESMDETCAKLPLMMQASMGSSLASITTDVGNVVADIKRNAITAQETANNAFNNAAHMMRAAIFAASSNLVEMCRLKVLGNELEADKSYQKAVQVLKEGDFALAKLYCMNAINHSPTKKLYFEKLLEISAKAGDETHDDLEQLKGALELGIFQVAADDVLGMRNMLAGVIEKLNRMDVVARQSREEEEKNASDTALISLREGDMSYDSVIDTNSEVRLVLLQRRLALLRDLDKTRLATNDVAWVEEQEACTRVSLEYFSLVNSIESYLLRAEKLLEEDPSKLGSVNVMVQTASQLLSQVLGIGTASLTATAQYELHLTATAQNKLQSFTKRIEAIEIKFNKIKSKPAIAEIHSLITKAEEIEVEAPYQEKIDSIGEILLMISQKMAGVFDLDERNSLENEIKKVSSKLGECRQAQYKAYQSWAIDRCNAGMDKYRSWTRVDIVDAEKVVYNYLIEIDSTLLSPDVARLYQDVLGKQFAELKDHTVKVEIDLAKYSKKQLSDF